MATPKPPAREQEHSIRDRKAMLFERYEPAADAIPEGGRKTFAEYLQTTPAEPLSPGIKALLGLAAAIVVLVLLAAVLKGG